MKRCLLNYLVLLGLIFSSNQNLWSQEVVDSTAKPERSSLLFDFYKEDFNPFAKSRWFLKVAFDVRNSKLENSPRQLDVVLGGKENRWNVKSSLGYYFSDYIAAILAFNASEERFEGDVINFEQDSVYRQTIERTMSIGAGLRISIPLTKNQRISFYNDATFSLGGIRGLLRSTTNIDQIDKTKTDAYFLSIGLSPGIVIFAVENFALEVGLDLIGYTHSVTDQLKNDVDDSRQIDNILSFKINLLSLNLGVSYYFKSKAPLKPSKK